MTSRARLIWSPTDLVNFVACEHLSALERQVALGALARPVPSEEDALVSRKGDQHERAQLEALEAAGIDVAVLPYPRRSAERDAAARGTHAAMRSGAAWIHNATFVDGDFSGTADFLMRVGVPSELGDWSYEVVDAKLSASAKPAAILQLCAYTDRLTFLQGSQAHAMHLILGDGRRETFVYNDFSAYYRLTRDRFLAALTVDATTYPDPVVYCERCRWNDACAERRRADDHLSEVADIRRRQIDALVDARITTLTALATADAAMKVPKLRAQTFDRLRLQAALQFAARSRGEHSFEYLPLVEGTGFGLLPPEDFGDVYFDMEGDPFYEGGSLEYLFGVTYRDDAGRRTFQAFWGHDRTEEARALEAFVDFVVARRVRYPGMHVYHYAPYETSAVGRLVRRYSTREAELDDLLRGGVFVDLYKVVRQSLVISTDNYSIKSVEKLYRAHRSGEVISAMGSVVAYERWRETRDPVLLQQIGDYNRDDCDSTMELHAWLIARAADAFATLPVRAAEVAIAREISPRVRAETEESDALRAALGANVDVEPPGDGGRWLTGALLQYHRREARPEWRAHFERINSTVEELVDDADAFADCVWDGAPPQSAGARSEVYTLTAPAQESKLRPGAAIIDPLTKSSFVLMDIDPSGGRIRVKRGKARGDERWPRAFIAGAPVDTGIIRRALRAVACAEVDGIPRFTAVRDIVAGAAPRLAGGMTFDAPDGISLARIAEFATRLDNSYLFIQGPPGSGKTYTGARIALALMQAGKRVGVTSRSHKAIHHLLHGIEDAAREAGVAFRGIVKVKTGEDDAYVSRTGSIEPVEKISEPLAGDGIDLIAGTAWAMAADELRERLDVLIVDEAGQMALADAVAAGSAARNIVLLGDPMQLAHVSQAVHPPRAGTSVLEHLLAGARTVAPDRGVFLPESFRMHPAICDFISTLMYDNRLHAAERCAPQRIIGDDPIWSGAGLRAIDVEHAGNVRESPEEARAIVDAVRRLIGHPHVDVHGCERALTQHDILVVAPYNVQVRRIAATLEAAGFDEIAVGTVDKFQGQEAPVVFFSLTASSGDEVPRGIDFLFSRNRLNVAISRAGTLAVLVSSPQLLTLRATTVEDLKLVNAVASFRERAASAVPLPV
ncbi:MAG: TM0106 family RecB-like putative nuclease [Candidatus Velthaea sp.]